MNRIWAILMHFCRCCFQLLAKPFHIEVTDEKWSVWKQFMKFVLVGCSNAVVTLLTCDAVILIFGKHTYLAGQTFGYIAGILNSYYWNSRFVFSADQQGKSKAFVRMCMCYGMTYFLQMALLYLMVEWCNLSAFLSPALAIVITTPVNFILNRLWAFPDKSK